MTKVKKYRLLQAECCKGCDGQTAETVTANRNYMMGKTLQTLNPVIVVYLLATHIDGFLCCVIEKCKQYAHACWLAKKLKEHTGIQLK